MKLLKTIQFNKVTLFFLFVLLALCFVTYRQYNTISLLSEKIAGIELTLREEVKEAPKVAADVSSLNQILGKYLYQRGQYEHAIPYFAEDSEALTLIQTEVERKQAIQRLIYDCLNTTQVENVGASVFNKLISIESVQSMDTERHESNITLLLALFSSEQHFLHWDEVIKVLKKQAEEIIVKDPVYAKKLQEVIQYNIGDNV
jgi:hypothetical protein